MDLYHFTAPEYLLPILQHGIARGDVPTTPTKGFNAPWLTSDPSWEAQLWGTGSILDKARVRLTVAVPDADEDWNLKKWSIFAKHLKVPDYWYGILNDIAGGGADSWYLYMGIIQPSWIIQAEVKDNSGRPLMIELPH